jgi:uncharacterized sporulation protein YeaH/YhbH (DUF444 family)
MQIVDRRLNPSGRSLSNRQRFIRRARELVREAVREAAGERSVRDLARGGEVTIPAGGVNEPQFHRAAGGLREHVLSGNREFLEGDRIPRPRSGEGGGREGSLDGKDEDSFRFALTQEEFLDLFLEDLELPELARKRLVEGDAFELRRAGFGTQGSPANLALGRTMRNAMSRRIALRRPKPEEIERLEEELRQAEAEAGESAQAEALREKLALLRARGTRIPYIDPIDVRYRQFEPAPRPVAQAVMFCLMDVSGSMTEAMKDLAKRFYLLLHLFLSRGYRHVEVVFIRHTHEASEVDEETFFRSPETGGTVVSTAFEVMLKAMQARYDPADWNVYVAQASDGDNASGDRERTTDLLSKQILPVCQYYAYLEIGHQHQAGNFGFVSRETELWNTYVHLGAANRRLAMRKASHRREIYPVFRELFRKGAMEGAGP